MVGPNRFICDWNIPKMILLKEILLKEELGKCVKAVIMLALSMLLSDILRTWQQNLSELTAQFIDIMFTRIYGLQQLRATSTRRGGQRP